MGDFTHLTEQNQARMVHLGPKLSSERSARVAAQVRVSPGCAERLLPAMAQEIGRTARLAGMQAAKQTSLLIPLCHQVALSGVDVQVTYDKAACLFRLEATAHTQAARGVEMEAMCAISIAAVTIYDMVKGVDPEAVIESIALLEKKGGKRGHWVRNDAPHLDARPAHRDGSDALEAATPMSPSPPRPAAIIVSSDRAYEGTYQDQSGPAATRWLTSHGFTVVKSRVLADDPAMLQHAVSDLVMEEIPLIVISGGTGLGPRDITPQTLDQVCDYGIPGFGEILRRESLKYSLNAYLSRGGGWVKGRSLILALPGHPKAVVEQLSMLEDLLPHALKAVAGTCNHRRSTGISP